MSKQLTLDGSLVNSEVENRSKVRFQRLHLAHHEIFGEYEQVFVLYFEEKDRSGRHLWRKLEAGADPALAAAINEALKLLEESKLNAEKEIVLEDRRIRLAYKKNGAIGDVDLQSNTLNFYDKEGRVAISIKLGEAVVSALNHIEIAANSAYHAAEINSIFYGRSGYFPDLVR
ncbi:MAG: hypothetical protein ACP5GD_02990 [Candidatus Micrarchaeia archaeon]